MYKHKKRQRLTFCVAIFISILKVTERIGHEAKNKTLKLDSVMTSGILIVEDAGATE